MNRCKDCRWWLIHTDIKGECDQITNSRANVGFGSFQIEASADDDSNLCAALITGPEFGCTQFEPKS
jgi:hypothetical protein